MQAIEMPCIGAFHIVNIVLMEGINQMNTVFFG